MQFKLMWCGQQSTDYKKSNLNQDKHNDYVDHIGHWFHQNGIRHFLINKNIYAFGCTFFFLLDVNIGPSR